MSASFFEEFAKLLKPNCQRLKTDRDYYGSPLRALGLDDMLAYRIDPAWIHLSEDENDHATHLCLGDLADEKISALGPGVKNHRLKICRDRIAYIYLAEVLLSIFPNPESAELKGRFFEEADTYFNNKNKAKGEKTVAPDGHKINEKTYELLVRACLATIWAEYRKQGRPLPKPESHCVNSDYFKVYKEQIIQRPPEDKTRNKPSLKEMEKYSVAHLAMRQLDNDLEKQQKQQDNNKIVEIDIKKDALDHYFSLYEGCGEKLAAALERNFWCYVRGKKLTFILRKNRNVNSQPDSLDGIFYVAFLVEPWKGLFRKHKEYKIDYSKNGPGNTENTENTESFSFYPKHTRSVFYETLLLIDLYEHLKKPVDPLTGKPLLSGAEAPESAKLKTARKLAQQLDKAMKNNSKNSRFVRDPATMSPKQNTVMPSPLYVLDRYTEVSINVPQNDYEPCTIELRVPEEELYKSAGESMVLSFQVFYRCQDRYEDIACDLVSEELGTDADPKTTFTLEVAQWRCADAGLDPDKTGCMAAFSGVQGAGEVVVVFAN